MFGKGKPRAEGVKLAVYMMKGHPGERAELIGMRGFGPVSDLRDGMRNEDIRARDGTKGEKPFFHAHFRSADGEGKTLSRAQWLEIADRCDRKLGLGGQPRAASLHIDRKTGDMHMHLGYSLVAEGRGGQLYIKKLGLYKIKLKELCREIERDYGLRILDNERQPGDRAKSADRNEFEESRRLGTDIKAIRTGILDCFEKSDNGKALKAALDERGLQLANGDRRDCFVVIDAAGGQHALNKKLTGKTLAEIRTRLADLDRAQLPGVDQAKELQAERQAARAAQERGEHGRGAEGQGPASTRTDGRERGPQPEIKPLGKTAGEIRLAWQLTQTAGQFKERIEDKGLILVHVSREEAEDSHRKHAFAKAVGNQRRELREGFAVVDRRGNVTRIDQRVTGDQWEEIQKRLGRIDKAGLASVADAKEAQRQANRAEWKAIKEAERAKERIDAPVGKTAGEIRMAWNTSRDAGNPMRDAEQLQEALAARGLAIGRVDPAEAYASERVSAFAKEAGNRATVLAEGELVAVNSFGNVYRFDERTTGELRHAIEQRLAGIDAAGLLNLADTKAAIIEAARAANADARREAEDKARPASWIETRIAECRAEARELGASVVRDGDGRNLSRVEALADRFKPDDERSGNLATVYGAEAFAARLDQADIAIVRVTAADVLALDALRRDEDMRRSAAETNGEAYKGRHFAQCAAGDIAAVTRRGDVHRLNPYKLDLEGLESTLKNVPRDGKGEARLASATEARAAFEIENRQIDALWAGRKAEAAAEHLDRMQQGDARTEIRQTVAEAEHATSRSFADAAHVVKKGILGFGSRLLDTISRPFTGLISGAADWIAPTAPPTREEAQGKQRAAEEQERTIEGVRSYAEQEAALQELLRQQRRDEAQQRLRRERGEERDDDRGREREL
jgi:hypothetical protein